MRRYRQSDPATTGRLLGTMDVPAGSKLAFVEAEGETQWWVLHADGTGHTLDIDGATFAVDWRASPMGALRFEIGEEIEEVMA